MPLVWVMFPTAAANKHLLYDDTILGSFKDDIISKLSSEFCQLNYVIIEKISIVDQYFFGTSTIDRNR